MGLTLNALKKLEREGVFESQSSAPEPEPEKSPAASAATVANSDQAGDTPIDRSDRDLLESPSDLRNDDIPLLNRSTKRPELYGLQDSASFVPPSVNKPSDVAPPAAGIPGDPFGTSDGERFDLPESGPTEPCGPQPSDDASESLKEMDVLADGGVSETVDHSSDKAIGVEPIDTLVPMGAKNDFGFLPEPIEKHRSDQEVESPNHEVDGWTEAAPDRSTNVDPENPSEPEPNVDEAVLTETAELTETEEPDALPESDSIESQILAQTESLLSDELADSNEVDVWTEDEESISVDSFEPHALGNETTKLVTPGISDNDDDATIRAELEIPTEREEDLESEEEKNFPLTDNSQFGNDRATLQYGSVLEDDVELPAEDKPEIEEDYNIPATDSIPNLGMESVSDDVTVPESIEHEDPFESSDEPEIEEDYNIPATDRLSNFDAEYTANEDSLAGKAVDEDQFETTNNHKIEDDLNVLSAKSSAISDPESTSGNAISSIDEVEHPYESVDEPEIEEDYNIPATDSLEFSGSAQEELESWSDDYELPTQTPEEVEIDEDYNIPATDSLDAGDPYAANDISLPLTDETVVPSESTDDPEVEDELNIPATDELIVEKAPWEHVESDAESTTTNDRLDFEAVLDKFENEPKVADEPAPFYNPVLSPIEFPDSSDVESEHAVENPVSSDVVSPDVVADDVDGPLIPVSAYPEVDGGGESTEPLEMGEFGIDLDDSDLKNSSEDSNLESFDSVSGPLDDSEQQTSVEESEQRTSEVPDDFKTESFADDELSIQESSEFAFADMDLTLREPPVDSHEEVPAAFDLNASSETQHSPEQPDNVGIETRQSSEITSPTELERKILERLTNRDYEKSFAQIADKIADEFSAKRDATIVIASPNETARGAILTAHLGVLLSINSHKKVILVDGDSKKQTLSSKYEVEAEPGFSDLLDDRKPVDGLLRNTAIESIRLLPFGDSKLTKHNGETIKSTVSILAAEGDFCLVNGGQMKSAFTEKLIANAAATIMFVEAGKTTESQLKTAAQRVRNLGGNLIGCVVGGIYKQST